MPQKYLDEQGNEIQGGAPGYLDDQGNPVEKAANLPTAATPPTMQAAPPETLGQRASAIWNSPIPGLTTKSPKEIGTELLHGAEVAVPTGMMAGPVMTEGLGATALGAARGIAGASGGAYLGRRGGEELGRLVGAPELGGKVGGVLGSLAGGYGAIKSPEMIEGYLGRLLGKPTSGVGVVGSAAQEAGYEPPVLKIPEPTGPKMIRAEQVPGPDTAGKGNLLTPAAVRGEEGAGKELMGRGRNVLYTVPEYEGTTPKMKSIFREPRYAYRGTNPGEGEVSGAKYDQLTTSPEEAASYARQKGGKLIRVDLNKLPEGSFDISGGIGMPNLIRTLKPIPKHMLEEIPLK